MATGDLSRRTLVQSALAAAPLAAAARLTGRAAAPDEIVSLGAREAVDRIRKGDLTAEHYCQRLLQQLAANRDLNVVSTIDEARVLEAARAVDQARAKGKPLGPAAGLPFAVKDQISVAGYPATAGNAALRPYVPKRNAAVVEKLVEAGAIPFCLTTLPDMVVIDGLMHQIASHSDAFGAVRNPYDRTRIPGGSSGGCGAILAARIVPAALGEDTNGSVRCPSAHCGTSGLRPSTFTIQNALEGTKHKRYSDEGLNPPTSRLDTIGSMARTVSDVAFLDAIITGEVTPVVDLKTVRIAVPGPRYWQHGLVDPAVGTVHREAYAKLRAAGCTLVEIDLDDEVRGITGTFDHPTDAATLSALGLGGSYATPDVIERWVKEIAPGVTIEQVYRGRKAYQLKPTTVPAPKQRDILLAAQQRYADLFRRHRVDAIGFPTIPMVASPIRKEGPLEPIGPQLTVNGMATNEGLVVLQNIFFAPRMGAAGLSLPAGMAGGLPVGLELDAQPGHDARLLGIGIAVQRAIGLIPPPPSV